MRGMLVWLGGLALAVCAACVLLAPPVMGAEEAAGEAGARDASFVGIGAMLEAAKNEDTGEMEVVVTGTLDGGPAAEAGIQKGDVITHVDGAPVAGLAIMDVVKLIRGEAGTEVKVTLRRAGQDDPVQVTLERKEIRPAIYDLTVDEETRERLAAERGEDFQRMAAEQELPIRIQVRPGGARIGQFQLWPGASSAERMPAQLVVEGAYLYVLRGHMLYQFEVAGLKLVAKSDLRTDEEKEAEMQ